MARDLFASLGYQGVRIDAIVKKAKVNKTTFYYHYKGKRALFKKIMLSRLNAFHAKLSDTLSGPATSVEKVDALVDLMFSRELLDVQLFTREIIEGGNNMSEEMYGLISEIVQSFGTILKDADTEDTSFLVYLLAGTSDFFLSLAPFRKTWLDYSLKNGSVSHISFDDDMLKEKLKRLMKSELGINESCGDAK